MISKHPSQVGSTAEILKQLHRTKVGDYFEIPYSWSNTLWTLAKKNGHQVKARRSLDRKTYAVWIVSKKTCQTE
jgi:hypothetical protein